MQLYAFENTEKLMAGLRRYARIQLRQNGADLDAAKAAYEQATAAQEAAFDLHLKSILDEQNKANYESARKSATAARERYEKLRNKLVLNRVRILLFFRLLCSADFCGNRCGWKIYHSSAERGQVCDPAAHAKRHLIGDIEQYYWLQPVSMDGESQRVQNFSNNNLTSTPGTSSMVHTLP